MDNLKVTSKKKFIEKIISKKELSKLPPRDVQMIFNRFDGPESSDYEKLKLTRAFLMKVYTSFLSRKLLNLKYKDVEWVLKKHKSTKERLPYYKKIYGRIIPKESVSVIDLGAGVNGFSYGYFRDSKVNYIATEAVGQLVGLMNLYFKKEKIKGKAHHISLFDLKKTKKLIKDVKGKKIILMFKVIDSLEVMERNYSKEVLKEIGGLADKIVLSFATKSLNKGQGFFAQRNWVLKFIKENFKVLDDFEYGGERYLVFKGV